MAARRKSVRHTLARRRSVRRLVAAAVSVTTLLGLVQALAGPTSEAAGVFHPAKPNLGKPVPTAAVAPVPAGKAPASSQSVDPSAPATLGSASRTVTLDRSAPITIHRGAQHGAAAATTVTGQWLPAAGSGTQAVSVAAAAASSPSKVTVEVLTSAAARAAGVAGAAPLAFALRRADGGTVAAPVAVRIPDALLAGRYGADYAERVRWVQVSTSSGHSSVTPVAQSPDPGEHGTVLTPNVTASPTVLSAQATTSSTSGTGDFSAASLKSASAWQVSAQTGAFTWSDPLRVPPGPAGPAPSLTLSYDSQPIDGETGSTNNQPSDLGEGWALAGGGSISRSYTSCSSNDGPGGVIKGSADLCWGVDNASISLAGHSGALVPDGSNSWRIQGDDDTRVQYLTGTSNGTYDGDYWKITTTNGTQYFFGLNELPGWTTGARTTGSAYTVPVCGTAATPCSGTSTTATPFHAEAWQWNLDYVVDVHHNAEALYYSQQTNRYAENGSGSVSYVRGGQLSEIDYGLRSSSLFAATSASDKVLLGYAARCETGLTNEPSTACSTSTPTASYWPDVPWDQNCASTTSCTQKSPSFWSSSMLSTVTTEYLSGTSYAKVDVWTLGHSWPSPGDGTSAALWLTQIAHTGYSGTASLSTPTIVLSGSTMQNRVWTVNGLAPLDKYRISSIKTDTGALLTVTYSPQQCTPTMVAELNQDPQDNTDRCYPQWWVPKTTPPQAASLDWFHKYLVTAVDVDPVTGGTDDLRTETDYLYTGTPAWRFDTNPGVLDSQRTWSVWAGYDHVEVRSGDPNIPAQQHTTDYSYFQGLDGDAHGSLTDPTSSARSASITSSTGLTETDLPQWAGDVFETRVRLGSSGGTGESSTPMLSDTVTVPWTSAATASSSRSYSYTDPANSKTYSGTFTTAAYYTGTASTTTTSPLSTGGTRTSVHTTSYDSATGLPLTDATHSYDTAASGTISGSQQTCSTTTYAATDSSDWIVGLPARVLDVGTACGASVNYPASTNVSRGDVISDTATYYDGSTSLGAAPTLGDATQTSVAVGYSGTSPSWQVASTAQYDALGRVSKSVDPNAPGGSATTGTSYTPATGGPLTKTVVTNPKGWTTTTALAPAWGETSSVTDQNGVATSGTFDALGRLTAMWLPNRPQASNPSSPSMAYAYSVSTTAPSALTTTQLTPSGGTLQSFTLFDGMGRVRQAQQPAEGGGIDVVDTSYDANGQPSVVSAPYYATGTASTKLITPTTTLPSQTETLYDGAGRQTATVLLVDNHEAWRSSTSYAGADRTDTVPPAGGTPTTTLTDPRGHATGLLQYLSSTASGTAETTSYGYDAAGEMTSMQDPAGNVWSWTYNLQGQLVRSTDPDSGAVTATYDADGNVASTTDAVGHLLTYSYDALNRKTAEYAGTGASAIELASWQYDQAALGTSTTAKYLGKISATTSFVGGSAGQPGTGTAYTEATNSYDLLGNPTKQTTTLGGSGPLAGSYPMSLGYNPDGSLQYQLDPAEGGLPSEKILTGYDSLGNPSGLGTSATYYVSSVTYTHLGQVAQIAQIEHAQVYQTPSYDPGTGRLTEYLVQRQATSNAVVADDHYSYDDQGLLTEDQNVTPATGTDTQCFGYDHLLNLTEAWTPGSDACSANAPATGTAMGGPAPYWTSYDADPGTGNRADTTTRTLAADGTVSGSDTATYNYPPAGATPGSTGPTAGGPNAVSSVVRSDGGPTESFGYDADGSTVSMPGHTISYDANERPATQTVAGAVEGDVYDADGNLLLSNDPSSGWTAYLGDTQLHVAAGSSTVTGSRSYVLGGRIVAERDIPAGGGTATLSFIVANPQGTAVAAVNDATSAVTRRYFDPYGAPRGAATSWPDASSATSLGNHGFLNKAGDLLTQANAGTTDQISQLGARQYDPTLGRFLSVDPVTDTSSPQQVNGYSYADNSPTNTEDPGGTDPPPIGCLNTACYNCLYADQDCGQMKQAPPQQAAPPGGGSSSSGGSKPAAPLPTLTPKQISQIKPILQMFIDNSPSDCATKWQQSTCWNNPDSFAYQALMERIRHVIYGGPKLSDMLKVGGSAVVGFVVALAGVALCGETAGAGCLAAVGAVSGLAAQCVQDCKNATALGLSAVLGAVAGGAGGLDGDPAYTSLEHEVGGVDPLLPKLTGSVLDSFEGGTYTTQTFKAGTTFYRAEGADQGIGSFFGFIKPATAAEAEKMYNIAKWGNNAEVVTTYRLTQDTTMYVGDVAGGSAQQALLPRGTDAGSVFQQVGQEQLP